MLLPSITPVPELLNYEFIRSLKEGGQGRLAVYRSTKNGHLYVAKFPLSNDPRLLERFRREVRALSLLNHPNVLRLERAGGKERPYLLAPYHETDLRARLATAMPFEAIEAARVALCVARGLKHAHECGILHRDIKPSNVLLGASEVVIGDWGLARIGDEDSDLTHTGERLGTPGYWAPEQAEGRIDEIDERTDVFGLGKLLAAMGEGLGRRPPRALRDIVTRCTKRERAARYPNVALVVEALECYLEREEERR